MQLLHRNVNDRVIKKGGTPATFPLHLHDVWPADYSPVEKFTFSWLNYIFFFYLQPNSSLTQPWALSDSRFATAATCNVPVCDDLQT